MRHLYVIKLRRIGRYKEPSFNIVVTNQNGKLVAVLGRYAVISSTNAKNLFLNRFLLIFWLSRGAFISSCMLKFVKIFFFIHEEN